MLFVFDSPLLLLLQCPILHPHTLNPTNPVALNPKTHPTGQTVSCGERAEAGFVHQRQRKGFVAPCLAFLLGFDSVRLVANVGHALIIGCGSAKQMQPKRLGSRQTLR